MSPAWILRTGRLAMTPVAWTDLPDLQNLKSDPRVFAMMLGGVRNPVQTAQDMASDIAFWGQHGCGIWCVRQPEDTAFLGIAGFMLRPDGLGIALRFALWPEARGRGLAREAAGAALQFGHERAGLNRVVAVARDANMASRTVLGSIGMVERGRFVQGGHSMILYESIR